MDLPDLQRHWDTFGRRDPFWAILTDPARCGNRWTPEEFFETGRLEVEALLEVAARLGVPRRRRRALDFGCGAGRLTQALGDHFETVLGVDVAPSMVALARAHNRHGTRCAYEVNAQADLVRLGDAEIDLVYTSRVLQHIEPRYAVAYVREFVRVLAPGGYLSFDLPSEHGLFVDVSPGALPASAMRATLSIEPDGPIAAEPGGPIHVQVTITNQSAESWSDTPEHPLNVGNHWLEGDGALRAYDDRRVKVPLPLEAGDTARVRFSTIAPDVPGEYRLQCDVVQEGVAWFETLGSVPADVLVRVGDPLARPAARTAGSRRPDAPPALEASRFDPVMEMHAVSRSDVEALLQDAGARLLDVRRVHHCGPTWLAYRYDVTR